VIEWHKERKRINSIKNITTDDNPINYSACELMEVDNSLNIMPGDSVVWPEKQLGIFGDRELFWDGSKFLDVTVNLDNVDIYGVPISMFEFHPRYWHHGLTLYLKPHRDEILKNIKIIQDVTSNDDILSDTMYDYVYVTYISDLKYRIIISSNNHAAMLNEIKKHKFIILSKPIKIDVLDLSIESKKKIHPMENEEFLYCENLGDE
jgi:hypothetical protein